MLYGTAPMFVVKLPREKVIKVGATLLLNCIVEKTYLQERPVGVDFFAKGEPGYCYTLLSL